MTPRNSGAAGVVLRAGLPPQKYTLTAPYSSPAPDPVHHWRRLRVPVLDLCLQQRQRDVQLSVGQVRGCLHGCTGAGAEWVGDQDPIPWHAVKQCPSTPLILTLVPPYVSFAA